MSKKTFEQLNNLLKLYLESKDTIEEYSEAELEIRFGTRKLNKGLKITKINYDNVVKKLLSLDFEASNIAQYYLRISPEKSSKNNDLRVELNGLKSIQNYCISNELPIIDSDIMENIKIISKEYFRDSQSPDVENPVNFDDFSFRVSYQTETLHGLESDKVSSLRNEFKEIKKFYRLIKRFTFTHKDFPVNIDMSIVKESIKNEYNIKESNIFNQNEKYEIEIEIDSDKITKDSKFSSVKELDLLIKKLSKYILTGLQETNYPISYDEQNEIANEYLKMIKKDSKYNKQIQTKDFIGPSSFTLQMNNIAPVNSDSKIVNIRQNYTVTDKADGDRKILYINKKGKIYLLTTNMNIQFTGAQTNNSDLFNSILDGEHILHNKKGQYINLYAAFDIYIINNKDVRSLSFTPSSSDESSELHRLPLLVNFIQALNPVLFNSTNKSPPIRIENKQFQISTPQQTIFKGCNVIYEQIKDGLFEYETDGLIFTPMDKGVGSNSKGEEPKSVKVTWDYSLKWKPPEFNTVDFLITTKKSPNGEDIIGNIFQNGIDTTVDTQINQYKTIILRVGFDVKKHGYVNPCANIIEDNYPSNNDLDNGDTYKPVQFFPTNPYDNDAGVTNIMITTDNMSEKQMFTEANEIIEDNMIVEFRYDLTRESKWRWVPLRVRYDKTADFRAGNKNYGNAYHVANSNWHSIHNPITKRMLTTGENISNELGEDDIYYNKFDGVSKTRGLRDFHNLFVKNIMISSVTKKGDTLIDYAMGKGGDLPKWINANISFVFGLDISRDNLENKLDGACARYLNYKKKFKVLPNVMFIQGNASQNIKKLKAQFSDKGKQITDAVFGVASKNEKLLGKGVFNIYGKGENGFNVSSIQFAMHYMFENNNSLQNFLTNVSECTQIGGYFIGTCFNGKKIFDILKDKKENESYTIMSDDKKITEITKRYDRKEFDDNNSCLGYSIDVYQESINKVFREYLVNFDYLDNLMQNYGFVKLTDDELKRINIPNSVGSFSELHYIMEEEINKNAANKNKYGQANNLTDKEKEVSFLNNYFIYKKNRPVDINDIGNALADKSDTEIKDDIEESLIAQQTVKTVQKKSVKKPVKKDKKIKLVIPE
jgi:hypothetical protein